MKIYMMAAVSCMSLSLIASDASSLKKDGNDADFKRNVEVSASIDPACPDFTFEDIADPATLRRAKSECGKSDKETKQAKDQPSKAQLKAMEEARESDEMSASVSTLLPILTANPKTSAHIQSLKEAIEMVTGTLLKVAALEKEAPNFIAACQEIPEVQAFVKKIDQAALMRASTKLHEDNGSRARLILETLSKLSTDKPASVDSLYSTIALLKHQMQIEAVMKVFQQTAS